jgi:hypothetical protein
MPTVEEALRARGDGAQVYLALVDAARAVVAAAEAECTPEAGERFGIATTPLCCASVAIMARRGDPSGDHGFIARMARILDDLINEH